MRTGRDEPQKPQAAGSASGSGMAGWLAWLLFLAFAHGPAHANSGPQAGSTPQSDPKERRLYGRFEALHRRLLAMKFLFGEIFSDLYRRGLYRCLEKFVVI